MAIDDNLMLYEDNLDETPPAVWPAFGLPLIEDLPDPFPLGKLVDDDFKVVVQRLVGEAVRCNHISDSLELIHRLRLAENLKPTDPQTYNFYHRLVILLKFVSFILRKPKNARSLFGESIVEALRAKVEVVSNLRDYFDLYEKGFGVDKEKRRELIFSLENNKEHIGQQPIVLEEERVVPTLQNWLKSYNASQPLTVGRSKFNQINYLNTSSNVRLLSLADKRILAKILEIYDWLLFPPPVPEINPEAMATATASLGNLAYLTAEKFELPEEIEKPESFIPHPPAGEAGPSSLTPGPLPPAPEVPKPERIISPPQQATPPSPKAAVPPQNLSRPSPFVKTTEDRSATLPSSGERKGKTQTSLEGKPTWDLRQDSSLSRALEKMQGPKSINIQDILHQRSQEEERVGGLKMGDGEQSFIPCPPAGEVGPSSLTQKPKQVEDSNLSVPSEHLPLIPSSDRQTATFPQRGKEIRNSALGEKNMEESIDKKLEELKKKLSK
jgi:hypothetical protein